MYLYALVTVSIASYNQVSKAQINIFKLHSESASVKKRSSQPLDHEYRPLVFFKTSMLGSQPAFILIFKLLWFRHNIFITFWVGNRQLNQQPASKSANCKKQPTKSQDMSIGHWSFVRPRSYVQSLHLYLWLSYFGSDKRWWRNFRPILIISYCGFTDRNSNKKNWNSESKWIGKVKIRNGRKK